MYVELWVEPRALCMLAEHSTNWAVAPAPRTFYCSVEVQENFVAVLILGQPCYLWQLWKAGAAVAQSSIGNVLTSQATPVSVSATLPIQFSLFLQKAQ